MATQTPNYNLIKPDYTDPVDVDVLNDNADLIDSALTAKANLVGGKVPASELPSYVDDVIEGYYYNGAFYEDSAHTTPITGEQGKIYIDLSTETCFRWSGSVYVQISSPDADFYWCTYDTTLDAQGIAEAYAELTAAFTAGRILVFYNSQRLFICNYYIGGNDPKFYFMSYDDSLRVGVTFGSNTGWSNWVTAIMATKQYVDNAIAEAGQLPQGTTDGDILYWDDTLEIWKSGDITKAATFDSTPTQNSLNPVTSGGVYQAILNAGGLPSGTNIGDILVWNGASWVAQQPSRLPYGYKEVEYIEGDGTQYIDTGIYLKGTSKVVLDFEYKAAFNAWAGVFGKYTSDSTNFCISWNSADGKVDIQHSSARLDNKTFLRNKRYLLSFGSNEVEYVDYQGTYSKATFVTGETLWLFAYSHSAKAEKIWSFRYYESDVELNHFIPCYRKSDNEIGMYDIVNNQFYTNAGTGTFIKGPDV